MSETFKEIMMRAGRQESGLSTPPYGFGEIAEPVPELKTFADLKTFDISSASKTQSAWTM